MYFGEYPMAFAACTNQFDCYRLLRAKRADPNAQDTNGNGEGGGWIIKGEKDK